MNSMSEITKDSIKFRDSVKGKISILFIFAFIGVIGFFVSNIYGSTDISIPNILTALLSDEMNGNRLIIWNVRLPRTIVAGLVGINLAVSGAILQGVMKNPLADPSIIGISSGAGLAAVVILILFPQSQHLVTPFAFVGAFVAAIMIYILSWKGGIQPMRVILAGVAVSALLGAGISGLMVFFSDRVNGALNFMTGSLSARSWPEVETILPYTIIGLILALILAKKINILNLGDEVARSLGLNVEAVRMGLTAVAALLAASAVSVAGLLGFVGLIVPHTVRLLIGNNYKYLIPGSALLGAGVMMLSDTVSRVVFSPIEIPVGIITAVLGAPFFLFLLRRD